MTEMAVAGGWDHARFQTDTLRQSTVRRREACWSLIHSDRPNTNDRRANTGGPELMARLRLGQWNVHLTAAVTVFLLKARRERFGREERRAVVAVLGEWEDVTCSILSPGCRAEAAGPSCCTLVTKIPYKSKWYTVRTTQGHDGLESLPFSFSSHDPPHQPPPPKSQNHIVQKRICQCIFSKFWEPCNLKVDRFAYFLKIYRDLSGNLFFPPKKTYR